MMRMPHVLRRLVRSPVFSGVSILTLGIGIGANTAIFSVVNGVLLKPLPYRESESLVGVWHKAPGLGFDEVPMSPAMYFTYRDDARTIEDIGVWDDTEVTITGTGDPERVSAIQLTDGLLPLLGIQALAGRTFSREDDSPDAALTVMLGWGHWQQRHGGDRGVVGQTVRVNGRDREIIGVLPQGFRLRRDDAAIYLPFQFNRREIGIGNFSYPAIARLREGATMAQLNAEVERLIPVAVERFPGNTDGLTMRQLREARFGANIRPLKRDVVGDVGNVLWVLLGTVGLVLLIACANVANLYLVRAEGRQQELAVRTAIGASHARVARQLLGESVVLGVLGGVLGLLLARAGLTILLRLAPATLPRVDEIGIDAVALLFTAGVSVIAGLLFGLLPAMQLRRSDLASVLREGGRGASAGKARHRARGVIATAEVALALVLLIGAGLMVRSFRALREVDPGFHRPAEVLAFRIAIPYAEVPEPAQVPVVYQQLYDRLAAMPGVQSVGLSVVTMTGEGSGDALWVEDSPTPPEQLPPIRRIKWMAGAWFETLETPLLAGRSITWADVNNRLPVVVLTENLARAYWSDAAAALGKRVRISPQAPWQEVVGVVGNQLDDGVSAAPPHIVYFPIAVADFWGSPLFVQRSLDFALRMDGVNPKNRLAEIRQAVASVSRNLPIANVRTLDEVLSQSMARTSFTLVMLAIAAVVALVLGVVGIYGVVAYIVAQRTREIGVRLALGATRADIRRLVVRQGAVYAGVGTTLGLLAAVGLTRLMEALLFGVSAADPASYAAGAAVVAGVTVIASWLPAVRAASLDPNEALRT